MKTWIAEIPCRAVKTVLIKAKTFKEAQRKLKHACDYGDDIEGIDVNYSKIGVGRVVGEDKIARRGNDENTM